MSALREKAAAAALERLQKEEAKKKEAIAKHEAAKLAVKKAKEEEILAKKRAAAEASERLERMQRVKSTKAKEGAKRAAEERQTEANFSLQNDVERLDPPRNVAKEPETPPDERTILEERTMDKHGETETSYNDILRVIDQKAEEMVKRTEETVKPKKKELGGSERLEETKESKSADVREAGRQAAEERMTRATHCPKYQTPIVALEESSNLIPKEKTINVINKQCCVEITKEACNNGNKHCLKECHGEASIHPKADGQKVIVTLTNANNASVECMEWQAKGGNNIKATVEEKKASYSLDKGNIQKLHTYTKICDQQGGIRPENAEEQSSGNYSIRDNIQDIPATEKERSIHNSEKEILTAISGDTLLASMNDKTNQYEEPNNTKQMNERRKKKEPGQTQNLQNEFSGNNEVKSVPVSYPKTDHQLTKCKEYTFAYHHQPKTTKKKTNKYQHKLQQNPPTTYSKLLCVSCSQKYDLNKKLPRYLYCGHSLCTECICNRIDLKYKVTCPFCLIQTWNVFKPTKCPLNEYLINKLSEDNDHFAEVKKTVPSEKLHSSTENKKKRGGCQDENTNIEKRSTGQRANNSNNEEWKSPITSPHGSKCLDMQVRPSYYCTHCLVWVCKECATVEHSNKRCAVRPLKEQLSEMKREHDLIAKTTLETLEKSLLSLEEEHDQEEALNAWIKVTLDSVAKRQKNVETSLQTGREIMNVLTDVKENEQNVKNLPEALASFQIIQDITTQVKYWSSQIEVNTTSAASNETLVCLKYLLKRTIASPKAGSKLPEVLATSTTAREQTSSAVTLDGGRLHLPVLRKDKPPNREALTLPVSCFRRSQDPSCALVFLDLSWGGRCRGRLYIRLIGDTLRGRNFISLCTGEEGVSFRMTSFHRTWSRGLPGEHIWGGDYEKGDGSGGKAPLSSRTQSWLPAGQKMTISAGLVAGRYESESQRSSIFRIYTQGDEEAKDDAGFGQVEFGLNVVRTAVQLKDISEVVISDCGLVLEV